MPTIRETVDYYVNLLCLQYRGLPRARANIAIYVKQAVADMLVAQVEDAFDVDSAVGVQLDTIGKYVGVNRNIGDPVSQPYFGFVSYNSGDDQNHNGFTDYNDPTINPTGIFFQYQFTGVQNTSLPDAAYALIVKLKIILNSNDGTLASIQDYLHTFLPGLVAVVDNEDMTMTYILTTNPPVSTNVLKHYLPKPMGVGVSYVFISATASPSSVSGTFHGVNPFGHIVTSAATTATAVNGSAPYTYRWRYISGELAINITTPTAASTTFSYYFDFGIVNQTFSAVFQCVVTDAHGIIAATNNVTVTIALLNP